MIRRLYLVINPKSGLGGNLAIARQSEAYLKARDIEVIPFLTEHARHAESWTQALPYSTETAVCGLGGDGTMHEIINGMMQRPAEVRMPVCSIPGGTGNSFLEDLQIIDPPKALETIARGTAHPMDLLRLELDDQIRYLFNVCGWGLFGTGNHRAESLRWLGKRRYDAAAICEILMNQSFEARFHINDEIIRDRFPFIVATNSRYVGKGMLLSPHARFDDGLLDLLYLGRTTRRQLIGLFSRLHQGRHIEQPGIHYQQIDRFEIHTDTPGWWNLDGEPVQGSSGKLEVVPRALKWIY